MKLEVGMYVRTKYGIAKYIGNHIAKATIYRVIDKKIVYDNIEDWGDCLLDNEIIKASHNIIELLEEGDYVNGEQVISVVINCVGEKYITDGTCRYSNEDIKSIVTKEQFESMSYKL